MVALMLIVAPFAAWIALALLLGPADLYRGRPMKKEPKRRRYEPDDWLNPGRKHSDAR